MDCFGILTGKVKGESEDEEVPTLEYGFSQMRHTKMNLWLCSVEIRGRESINERQFDESENSKSLNKPKPDCAEERMSGKPAGHGMDHVLRVLSFGSGDSWRRPVRLGDRGSWQPLFAQRRVMPNFMNGWNAVLEFGSQDLRDLAAGATLIEHAAPIVDNISFRKTETADALSLEWQVVRNADR